MLRFLSILLLFTGINSISAQQAPWSLAVEFQAYPTGLIPGLQLGYQLQERHSLLLRAGYNHVRHRDLGVHDDERGAGFGGTLGYRYFFKTGRTGWFAGARTDVWRNTIDWQDKDDSGNILAEGASKVTVLQPTAEAGYRLSLGQGPWFIAPAAAFGVEINVKTGGADVGEGLILLLGFSLGRQLN